MYIVCICMYVQYSLLVQRIHTDKSKYIHVHRPVHTQCRKYVLPVAIEFSWILHTICCIVISILAP